MAIEINPTIFFHTGIVITNGITETSFVSKESKILNHWSSAVPKKYKQNTSLGDLHTALKISSNFELEKQRIKNIYFSVNFPNSFIPSTFDSYQEIC